MQASELGNATAAMPLRVSRIDDFLKSVEAGDTKLRGSYEAAMKCKLNVHFFEREQAA